MLMRVVNPEIERSRRRRYDMGAALFMLIFTLLFGCSVVANLRNPMPPECFIEEIEAGF